MNIQCDHCRKTIQLQEAIDTDKFEGEITCGNCNYVWRMKLVNSKIQGYKFERIGFPKISGEDLRKLRLEWQKEIEEDERNLRGD